MLAAENKYPDKEKAPDSKVHEGAMISYSTIPWEIKQIPTESLLFSFFESIFSGKKKNGIEKSHVLQNMKSVLQKYLPIQIQQRIIPTTTPETYTSLMGQIEQSNNIAKALRSTWWILAWDSQPYDKDIARATRLLLCRQMVDQFKHEANNPKSTFSEIEIDDMYQALLKNLKQQREWFPGSFNKEMDKIQNELMNTKKYHLSVRVIKIESETISGHYQGSFDEKAMTSSNLLKQVPIQLAQISNDLAKLSHYKSAQSINEEEEKNKSQLQIAEFINNKQFALTCYLTRIEEEINTVSVQQLEGIYDNLIALAERKHTLSNIKRMSPFLDEPLSNLMKKIEKLTKAVELRKTELHLQSKSKKKNEQKRVGEKKKLEPELQQLPFSPDKSTTATLLILKENTHSPFPPDINNTVLSAPPLFSSPPQAEKKDNSEKDKQRTYVTDGIAYEAKRYIKERLDSMFIAQSKLDPLFEDILEKFKIIINNQEQELTYGEAAKKIQEMTYLNNADARKVVALFSIYIKAEEYQHCHPNNIAKKESLFASLKDSIQTAAEDLCAPGNYEQKYNKPEGYCASIVAISVAGGVYLNKETIGLGSFAEDEIQEKREKYKDVFEKYEDKANKLLSNMALALESVDNHQTRFLSK